MYGTSFYGQVAYAHDMIDEPIPKPQLNGPGHAWPVILGNPQQAVTPVIGAEISIPKGTRL